MRLDRLELQAPNHRGIAIIGMSGMFPGVESDLEGFWRGLTERKSCFTSAPSGRFGTGDSVLHGAYLVDADRFDAAFFGISPQLAACMDPQQRLLLQLAWAALEDAGYAPSSLRGSKGGVFLSVALNEYLAGANSSLHGACDLSNLYPGIASCRISDYLDWRGPSELVQSTCAGSLLALHRAVNSLRSGECDVALAGAANLLLSTGTFRAFEDAGMLSSRFTCSLFDERGDGFLRGEAAAIVMLKRMGDAVRDGDPIHAVIKGTAVLHSGRSPSLQSISVEGQRSAVAAACADAQVSAKTIRFLMMQGTGKQRSDEREIEAVLGAWAEAGDEDDESRTPRLLGCLKPNVGHLETASGIAGVLALAMTFRRGVFPAMTGMEEHKSKVDVLDSLHLSSRGYEDLADLRSVVDSGEPLRGAVNGFGLGGMNAHIILEEPPPLKELQQQPDPSGEGEEIFVFSGRSPEALRGTIARMRDFVAQASGHASMADIATTLGIGRDAMEYRYAATAKTADELIARLDHFLETTGDGHDFAERVSETDLGEDEQDQEFFARLLASGKRERLARLWVRGAKIQWGKLPGQMEGRRISLPTYPFARDRHWIGEADSSRAAPETFDGPPTTANATRRGALRTQTVEEIRSMIPPGAEAADEQWINASFGSLGFDSLGGLDLQSKLTAKLGLAVPLKLLLNESTPRKLLDHLCRGEDSKTQEPASKATPAATFSDSRYEPFPLTEMQLAYFLGRDESQPLSGNGCHLYWEFERKSWDIARLEQAWRKLVERHDMLRAVFSEDATQRILPSVDSYRIRVTDVHEADARTAEEVLLGVRNQLSDQRFDPGTWPLFALAVTILPASMRLHFGIDLLIADAKSLFLLLRELEMLYDSPTLHLPPIATTFRDFVAARDWLCAQDSYERSLSYWRNKATDMPGPPSLPQMQSERSFAKVRYTRHARQLNAEKWSKLQAYARDHGMTAAAVIVAAFADVIGLWNEAGPFTLNLTVAPRPQVLTDIDQIVGDFTSNVLLVCGGDDQLSFCSRAGTLRDLLVENLDHSAVSGVHVMHLLAQQQKTQASMPVVFTSLLGYRDSVGAALRIDGLGRFVTGVTQTPQVWLDAQAAEVDGGLYLSWDAVDELFPAGMMQEMFESFADLVDRLATHDACWNETAPARLPSGQRTRRVEANATDIPQTPELLHEGFLQQVRANPDAVAIVGEGVSLTYSEVFARAAGIARRLVDAGCGPGELVALVTEKSAIQIIGCLAVLMAGSAYLPIDASLPETRIRELLLLGECRMALTQEHLVPRGVWLEGITVIDMTKCPAETGQAQAWTSATPDNITYVIFTSGSTGVPKGVTIRHRSAANTVRDMNRRFAVGRQDRVLALSSLSFDLSVYDIFGSLAAGGAIVIPDPQRMLDPEYLGSLIEDAGVTVWNSVPSYLQVLTDGAARCLPSLRLILLSGDWIPVTLPAKARTLFPNAELISLGGATEASIWSIFHRIGDVAPDAKSILYGKPLANQRFHVLDTHWNDRPDWVAGELYIAGEGLAEGYWRDQGKTETSFPIHPVTGERLYRTGDWGRYVAEGNIEFLGRRDLQVKIGGHRVELGEVASVLAQCPGVRDAAAFTFSDQWQQKRLAAAIVTGHNLSPTMGEIRSFLSSRVQDYLVPQKMVFVERMPLTSTGKIDRRALERMIDEPAQPGVNSTESLIEELQRPEVLQDASERLQFSAARHGLRNEVSEANIPFSSFHHGPDDNRRKSYRSTRHFSSQPVNKAIVAALLESLAGREVGGKPKYLFPSAGDAYPVQTYLHVKEHKVDGIRPGFYYFHPLRNELSLIDLELDPTTLHLPANRAAAIQASFSLYFIADLRAIRPLYGKLGEGFCRIEAGHMGQLLRETAAELGLGLCPIGHLPLDELMGPLSLSDDHVVLYSFLCGLPAEAPTLTDSPLQPALTIPTTSHEQIIAKAWSEILKLTSPFPLDANLFELGGNSFAALQLHRVLTQREGLSLSVTDLFRYPTVRSLAARLTVANAMAAVEAVVEVETGEPGSAPESRRQMRRSIRERMSRGEGL